MDSVYDTPVVLDTLGRSDHRMVLLQPSCAARLDTANIQRAVVRRFTTNEKQLSHQHFHVLDGIICMQWLPVRNNSISSSAQSKNLWKPTSHTSQ